MSREFKFRVWDKLHKKWIGASAIELDGTIIDIHNAIPETNCIAQQYTGLKDSKGKEIYEGDIVKTIYDNIGVIFYHEQTGSYRIQVKNQHLPIVTYRFVENIPQGLLLVVHEVIGNIFENNDLTNV